ncbi:fumarylacetoacetate hydrolase family protein [Polymorphospora sp. NPDC051019]|uniref:fumarylacetoacetate hydrolase family protein n=1 Tax=Polymorphospora sp. NPDC051019 TaxID=3155725 RepID=UPI0034325F6F
MIVCRYADGGRSGYGRVEPEHGGSLVVPIRRSAGRWVGGPGRARPVDELSLLPPAEPTKIICVALNYSAAARPAPGRGRPGSADSTVVLLKPPSSLAGPEHHIGHPGGSWELRHEAELAVVIGTRCKRVPVEYAADVVAGYTCANDITAYARRDAEASGTPAAPPPVWAKHFDGCTPLGPWLATDLDPADVEITCRVDGRARQRGNTRDLIVPVPELIALISEHMTLLPGDVVLTGTPEGSGPLMVGSRVEVSIAGIGTLRNTVDMPSGTAWTSDGDRNDRPGPLSFAGRPAGEEGGPSDADR